MRKFKTHTHARTLAHTHTHTRTHAHVHAHAHVHTHAHIRTHTHTYAHTNENAHTRTEITLTILNTRIHPHHTQTLYCLTWHACPQIRYLSTRLSHPNTRILFLSLAHTLAQILSHTQSNMGMTYCFLLPTNILKVAIGFSHSQKPKQCQEQ